MRLIFLQFILILSLSAFAKEKQPPTPEKILLLRIDATGLVTDGRDTIPVDELAEYTRDRLFKSYMGTGKMYNRIRLERLSENTPPHLLEGVLKEIRAGQKSALSDYCLHKYKKMYENLEGKKQGKVRKLFPVLFQTEYS